MKNIFIAGAGKSSVFLIDYLLKYAQRNNWHITVADAVPQNAENKIKGNSCATAERLNIHQTEKRQQLVKKSDLVISMLPPALHIELAKDCLQFGKHLLTASYSDEAVKKMSSDITEKNLLFLYEMGLDPGIDHMTAMKMINSIQEQGGNIISFISHCGGLVEPENDDNPWHYKISWNPSNVVRAGKAGAIFKENGEVKQLSYEELFSTTNKIIINGNEYSFYANRDSLSYMELYNLHNVQTFMRTTLRHTEFMNGWKHIVRLGLTDEVKKYRTDNLSPAAFFKQHVEENNLQHDLPQPTSVKEQLAYLDLYNDSFFINKGVLSACDILQFLLEKKLVLRPQDKDLVIMQHEIVYEKEGLQQLHKSSIIVHGEDATHTAMARTVGLPLAIAATKILEGKISVRGLHIPIIPAIYEPVLEDLKTMITIQQVVTG